jgi:hypothetical protein
LDHTVVNSQHQFQDHDGKAGACQHLMISWFDDRISHYYTLEMQNSIIALQTSKANSGLDENALHIAHQDMILSCSKAHCFAQENR